MTEKELIDSLSRLGPSDAQVERMLKRIEASKGRKAKRGGGRIFRIALPAVCIVLLAFFLVPALNQREAKTVAQLRPAIVPFSAGIPLVGEGRSLDGGKVAKYLNYEGSRYRFIGDGLAFELGELGLEETPALGTLQYDILEDMQGGGLQGYASRDFGSTYLAGGTIYKLPGYDPDFRLAVKHQDRYYIAELAGRTDDSVISLKDYASLARLGKLTDQVQLMDSAGVKQLSEWSSDKAIRKLVTELEKGVPAALSVGQYEELASAQAEGKSYLIRWSLKDGTEIDMPIVPGMSLITVGDGNYELTQTFLNDYTTTTNP